MGSPFIFRLRVVSSKKGGGRSEDVIPIFAIKSGYAQPADWYKGEISLEILRGIAAGADGERALTVCTIPIYARRNLEERSVEFFELHIKDTRIATAPTEERRTVATISCKDMDGGKMTPVDGSLIKMTSDAVNYGGLVAVPLDFHNYDGGPVFARF